MAFDKVIDSAALDAGMIATANAIREKAGNTDPIMWDVSNGFKNAVEAIQAGAGGGLPAGITEIQTGSWTQATNDSGGSFTIPHGCSKAPRFVFVTSDYLTSGATLNNSITGGIALDVGTNTWKSVIQYNGTATYLANLIAADDSNLTFTNVTSSRWRQGNTYTWYAVVMNE